MKRQYIDISKVTPSRVTSRYEAAQHNTETADLWRLVDSLSAAAANSPNVRLILRNRSRYEYDNSPDIQGIAGAYVADLIGDRIGIQVGDDDLSQIVELEFLTWMRKSKFMTKLRTLTLACYKDGESFAQLITNPHIDGKVQLDIIPMEADQIEGYWTGAKAVENNEVDGIRFDKFQNPTEYRVLTQHPGDYRLTLSLSKTAGKWVKAEHILHMLNWSKLRPGQKRGVPETTSIMSLPNLMRQYILATVTAAKTAAEMAGVMETDLVPDTIDGGKCAAGMPPLAEIDIQRGCLISLPEGWKLAQMRAEHPTTNFKEFCDFLKSHLGRASNMPRNVAIGDSSGYNYASGRLDHQTWDSCLTIHRNDLIAYILDRIYFAFIRELIPELKAAGTHFTEADQERLLSQPPQWMFRRRKHVDPSKEANADSLKLRNAMMTREDYWAEQGEDGKQKTDQWLQEKINFEKSWNEKRQEQGLPPAPMPDFSPNPKQAPTADAKNDKGSEDEED